MQTRDPADDIDFFGLTDWQRDWQGRWGWNSAYDTLCLCGGSCERCLNQGFCLDCAGRGGLRCRCFGTGACAACGCGVKRRLHIQQGDGYVCDRDVQSGDVYLAMNRKARRYQRLYAALISAGLVCGDCVVGVIGAAVYEGGQIVTQSELDARQAEWWASLADEDGDCACDAECGCDCCSDEAVGCLCGCDCDADDDDDDDTDEDNVYA